MTLFKSNLDLLLKLNAHKISHSDIDFEAVEVKKQLSGFEDDMKEFTAPENIKVVKLPSYAPENEETARKWSTRYEKYRSLDSLDPYIDLHDDPHTCLFTSDLYLKALELNIDPDDTVQVATAPVQGLVCLGTGNGEFLQYVLETLKPYNLIVLVKRWEDLICSFDILDWDAINTHYSSPGHRIVLGRVSDDLYETLTYLSTFGIVSMESMLIYSPKSSDPELLDVKPYLTGREAQNLILYQGYTIDEYNMIYNSARFFLKKPKIYSTPNKQIANSVIVVGSGPSLDNSLEFLKEHSDKHVIVCGGSNYRTLMKNGIVPDFLVLVERADEVYDSYKSMFDEFGRSTTKLVVSTTCSDKLADIYDDVCVFYRPALTPLVVFGEGDNQKITYEGPQAVCAAFSFPQK